MIKSTKHETPQKPRTYPWLGQDLDRNVVLFNKPGVGTIVALGAQTGLSIGYMSDTWNISGFVDYVGTVELSNV